MSEPYNDYALLLKQFIENRLSPKEFQLAYLARFKGEERRLDESLFVLLDELFGDVDAYTDSEDLLSENPNFYISEELLRQRVESAAQRLAKLTT